LLALRFWPVALHSAFAGLFFYFYWLRYGAWRDCFNELGRCYDDTTGTVYTTSGLVWFPVACIFAALALLSLYRRWRDLRRS